MILVFGMAAMLWGIGAALGAPRSLRLSLLGILVPPIGSIIIADLYFVRPGAEIGANWRPRAFAAWFIGSLVAYGVETYAPQLSTAIAAFIAGGLGYLVLSKLGDRSASAVSASR